MARAERLARWRPAALLLAAALAGYGLLAHWWWTAPMLVLGERIAEIRDEELALRMEAAQVPALEARLAELRATEAADPGFLPEPDRELATAALVNRLEAEVRRAAPNPLACEIVSRTPMAVPDAGPFVRVTVQVRLRCDPATLAQVLHALEGGRPALFVDHLALSSLAGFFVAGQGVADGRIDVNFDLYGFLRPVAPPPARGVAGA
jgi:general secretion pathway protein M